MQAIARRATAFFSRIFGFIFERILLRGARYRNQAETVKVSLYGCLDSTGFARKVCYVALLVFSANSAYLCGLCVK
jgi:hypothetical protein